MMMSAAANANSASSRLNSEKQQDHWFLVLDGDIAVINSNHRIEEYIEASKNGYNGDVIHSLRFHNNEVLAYCYLVKNSKFGRDYIRSWAELYPEKYVHQQLGEDDDGRQLLHYGGANSDNGALHWHLLHRLADDGVAGWEECRMAGQAANSSETDVTYSAFVTCFHDVVQQTHCNSYPTSWTARGGGWMAIWMAILGPFLYAAHYQKPSNAHSSCCAFHLST
ncbi:hypothetical protein FRACYDRAFT_267561 [Fragilariopsis cylindrus CCMP1102]|uniref:Uncharacterized protein n=1 Tax=Fragilariopsis cylindrus CCMP1102 TaxID=635003 RepID=A0A1E7FZL1_9STRA|nr:hypothetical protein FRACYDRAFT_267561 [Fragilariopsis cylindrus CCMP1102]|eukprot:OEU23587.1 hypothetical protein FRACYDRAFT_267561 [Fragilariopsis cylindrus CCMP1102]